MPQNTTLPQAAAGVRASATPSASDRPIRHLNQVELSRRWSLSPRTLERWRWLRLGPPYLKVGGRVVYRLDDVEAYEAQRLHHCATTVTKPASASARS